MALLMLFAPIAAAESLPSFSGCEPELTNAVPDSYFSDAVFAGDSMMNDIEMFNFFPEANFVCRIGMSPASTGRKQFRQPGSDDLLTLAQAIAQYSPKKIYLLIGSNGLDNITSDVVLRNYGEMLDALTAQIPGAIFYLISPPPTTQETMAAYQGPNVGRYRNFEAGLRQLAEERQMYYIDLYHMIASPAGYLDSHYAASDGYHINRSGNQLLADYIKTHAVTYGAK